MPASQYPRLRALALGAAFLDAPQFGGPAHERTVFTYLSEKYATRPPDLLVAGNDEALSFLLRNRPALFPRIPIVQVVASRKVLQALSPLPPDVIRVPMDVDFSRTIEQALRLHPKARRLVIATGTAPQDRSFEAQLREDVVRFGNRVQPEFLSGLSMSVLLKRLAGLKADAVVFTPGLFQDGDGRSFLPREAVRAIAAAASVTVYAPFSTYLGTGIVGGCMTSTEAMGRDAGEIVSRLLDGTAPGSLGLTEPKPAPRLPTA